ncbi:MAG: hypothetical protein HOM25_15270 [Rhodospirillaceae bacterium]|jgi:hypothetical protein|nr:hypothetical protein [Rhodospirillaceae bacterium]MBT5812375.1 hypothetical protein [Rhodospirillaceae bacterium]
MFYEFTSSVHKSWSAWSGLCGFLPHADTFVARIALFFVVAGTCKMVADDRV